MLLFYFLLGPPVNVTASIVVRGLGPVDEKKFVSILQYLFTVVSSDSISVLYFTIKQIISKLVAVVTIDGIRISPYKIVCVLR